MRAFLRFQEAIHEMAETVDLSVADVSSALWATGMIGFGSSKRSSIADEEERGSEEEAIISQSNQIECVYFTCLSSFCCLGCTRQRADTHLEPFPSQLPHGGSCRHGCISQGGLFSLWAAALDDVPTTWPCVTPGVCTMTCGAKFCCTGWAVATGMGALEWTGCGGSTLRASMFIWTGAACCGA